MNFFNSKNKLFLDMSNAKLLVRSIVFIDDTLSKLKLEPNQTLQIQVKNPFEPIAHTLVLKSVLKSSVIENPNNTQFHKEFVCDDLTIVYDAFPPKLQIKHKTQKDENQIVKIAKDIIDFASVEKSVSKIGINYEMFLEEDRNIKDYLLKDSVAKGFTSLSATPVFEIDENTTLNLTIASAINNDGKKGIYFQANFDNKVTDENTLSIILDKKFRKMADEKINLIFG